MGANQDIYLASLKALADRFDIRSCFESGYDFNGDGPVSKAVYEVIKMLLCEQGGRHQHRYLLLVLRGNKRGAHCDLGLAEANIAAD